METLATLWDAYYTLVDAEDVLEHASRRWLQGPAARSRLGALAGALASALSHCDAPPVDLPAPALFNGPRRRARLAEALASVRNARVQLHERLDTLGASQGDADAFVPADPDDASSDHQRVRTSRNSGARVITAG